MAELAPDDAEMLRLVYWDGLGSVELAEALEISADAVRKRTQRARDALRERIGSPARG